MLTNREALITKLQSARDDIAAAIDYLSSPKPKPEPTPEPVPKKPSKFGWNLGRQNYWSHGQFSDNLFDCQIWPLDGYVDLDVYGHPQGRCSLPLKVSSRKFVPGVYRGSGVEFEVNAADSGRVERLVLATGVSGPLRQVDGTWPGSFTETCMSRYKHASVVRMMDVLETNSPIATVPLRHYKTIPGRRVWSLMHPELAIDFADENQVDVWWCFHHEDTDDHIRQVCEEFSDLGYEGKLYAELSNEVWNGQFPQHRFFRQLYPDSWAEFFRGFATETQRVVSIAKSILGDQVVGVLGSQLANYGVTANGLKSDIPDIDCVAVAPYFGAGRHFHGSTVAEWIDYAREDERTRVRDSVLKQKEMCDMAGVRLIAYEGGPHIDAHDTTQEDLAFQVLKSTDLAEIEYDHLSWWRDEIDDIYCLYNDVSESWWSHWEWERSVPHPRGKAALEVMSWS